ncbi:hypothetical protein PsorP6_004747 [Peronosclerospora sorghi]|uniref:Uncharacterized protein n=1 Tax=Peronosclerospora sorghi TaxID=230839 RepID=A0ACC0VPZ9_9STRA|nr:hypothetical protein PsorP6_004747 [Peronosclerospora sorghi]
MSTLRSPRDLVAACMDHIALEGINGVSVVCLFSSIDPSIDVYLRCQVWRLLRSCHGVLRFFRGSPAPGLSYSRKRVRPDLYTGENTLLDVKQEMKVNRVHALDDKMLVSAEEMELISYEAATTAQQPQLIVVACMELRHRALNIPVKAIAADLGDAHLRILEAVGRTRVQGATVTALMNLQKGGTVKKLHNCLDLLISYGLVVKRMMIVARPIMRRLNIIHLPRFAADFKPQMFDKSADFESDEQSKKIMCAAAETYLKGLPTQSSVLADLGRDINLHRRHLEMLRSYIVQESKADENFPLELFQAVLRPSRRASLEPKILNCVRYKPPLTRKNLAYGRGIVLELGLLRQIYGIIEDSAENGATIIDLRNQIVLPGSKLPYKLVSVLAEMYRLKAESIILGKNKAFRLYLDSMAPSADNKTHPLPESKLHTSSLPTQSRENCVDEKAVVKVKPDNGYTLRSNKPLKMALGGVEVDGTSARRREHILERLEDEKIISLSSLCASVFNMERQRADIYATSTSSQSSSEHTALNNATNSSIPASAVGKVDTRSIFRIATELENMKKLRLLQLPMPARNVSTKFRALRCVVAPGYEKNDVFIQSYVKNYCRDERLRRIHRNVGKDQVVRIHAIENDNYDEVPQGSARKRRRANSKTHNASGGESKHFKLNSDSAPGIKTTTCQMTASSSITEPEMKNPALPEISYKIRRFVSQQKSQIHSTQYRKLGFAYGVMYRCKMLHRFLWKALHETGSSLKLPDDENDAIYDVPPQVDGGVCAGSKRQHLLPSPGIVFSRESVLHSMPIYLYIQVFSGGMILTSSEFAVVEDAIKHQRTFDSIPETLQKKIWSHESQRTAKVLGTLADLGLVLPHKIGMNRLVKILRAGYTDGRDGVLSRALNENALGGLFRFNKQARIILDDGTIDHPFSASGERNVIERRSSVNTFDSIRVVGFTEKTYSFADTVPLQFSFESEYDVDRYWEALECLCLEQMTMEVENPPKNEPTVCKVPKPVKTRARRMLRILAWILKSQKLVPKHKDGHSPAHFRSGGIVSTSMRSRRKRRLAQLEVDTYDGVKRRNKKLHKSNLGDKDLLTSPSLTWTVVHEKQLVDYFIDSCKSRWKIVIPQGLQRDKEQVAFRNHTISRTGLGLVAIARKLGKRKIDVKKRLKEKLMEPVVKLLLENGKRAAQIAYNPSGLFDEEVAIQGSTRLTALFRRAVMMIMSPREEYHPLVAEELISFWTPQEIRLVWRYLWLKNWIVRASEKERGRGYSTSQRLQDSLKVNTLSYPLLLFQQAAEQESIVCSTLEEITAGSSESHCAGPFHSDQLFEDDFPTNATPGRSALELGCQLLGTCSLTAVHSSVIDPNAGSEDIVAQTSGKQLSDTTRKESLLTCKNLRDRSGFAAHLANKVNVSKASDLIDTWKVETKMHAVTIEDRDVLSAFEAFSMENIYDNDNLKAVAFHSFQLDNETANALEEAVKGYVSESGEEGLTVSAIVEKVSSTLDDKLQGALQMRVTKCLNSLVDQGALICINAYYDRRYIAKEHGDLWLLRPFSLVCNTTLSKAPQVVFEGEKDTLSFPWLKMDGGTNYKFLFAIQRKLLTLIIQAPGITEKRAYTKMNKLLSLQDTREALSLLVEDGLVYARAVLHSASQATHLFTPSVTQPSAPTVIKLTGSVLTYDRTIFEAHYFPRLDCIQRFGSIVQDYQNEVFSNDGV